MQCLKCTVASIDTQKGVFFLSRSYFYLYLFNGAATRRARCMKFYLRADLKQMFVEKVLINNTNVLPCIARDFGKLITIVAVQ